MQWRVLERTRESTCERALYCVVMHCSACFRDRRNTRALHLSRCSQLLIPTHRPFLSSPVPHHRPVVQIVHLVQQISPHPPPPINSIRNYTQYAHASVIFIVLYPSCTHTHHIPTHLRLSFGIHDLECLHVFRHHTFPFLPKFSSMQVHKKKFHPLTPL